MMPFLGARSEVFTLLAIMSLRLGKGSLSDSMIAAYLFGTRIKLITLISGICDCFN